MAVVSGVIEDISERQVGAMKMYGVRIDGYSYGTGPIKPKFLVGDRVEFTVEMRGDFKNVKNGSMKLWEPKEDSWNEVPAIPPPAKINQPTASRATPMSKDDFWKNKEDRDIKKEEAYVQRELERQRAINFDSARKAAMEYVGLLASALGEDFWLKKGLKAADKYSLVNALVRDKTREFYNQAVNRDQFLTGGDSSADEQGSEVE